MAEIKESTKVDKRTQVRWISAIIGSLGILLFAFFVVKPETEFVYQGHKQSAPFIRFVNENSAVDSRNYEAFFLPTKHNFSLKIKPPKVAPNGNTGPASVKPIFSQLDRLRILRTFANRFSESEYWTVSRIQMHPSSQTFRSDKKFVENVHDWPSRGGGIIDKNYDIFAKFLFSENDIEHDVNGYLQ